MRELPGSTPQHWAALQQGVQPPRQGAASTISRGGNGPASRSRWDAQGSPRQGGPQRPRAPSRRAHAASSGRRPLPPPKAGDRQAGRAPSTAGCRATRRSSLTNPTPSERANYMPAIEWKLTRGRGVARLGDDGDSRRVWEKRSSTLDSCEFNTGCSVTFG